MADIIPPGLNLPALEEAAESMLVETEWHAETVVVGKERHPLCEEIADRRHRGITQYITKHKLDTSKKIDFSRSVRGAATAQLSGQNSTMECYLKSIKQLGNFAGRIGDYRTATICNREKCLFNPHPANPTTLTLFCYWKTQKRSDKLINPFNKQEVKDILGLINFLYRRLALANLYRQIVCSCKFATCNLPEFERKLSAAVY